MKTPAAIPAVHDGADTRPAEQKKVMHSELTTGGGLVLMAADMPDRFEYVPGNNHSISLTGEDEAELRGYWEKLSAGGTITMPLGQAPWGDTFGMCTDRLGVTWMVDIAGPNPPEGFEDPPGRR
jgi:PhnB protein